MINYKEVKDLMEKIPEFKQGLKCKETPHPQIEFNGGVILYRTAGDDGKYIRGHGKKIKRIRVDEAAYVKRNVLEGVIEPMSLDQGAELILQGTPFGKNYFYERYREGLEGDSKYIPGSKSFHFPTITNPHLDENQYERIKRRLGENSLQWKCEYLAEFVDDASAVFGWDLIESCFYHPPIVPEYSRYVSGIDLARYSDFTVCTVAGFDRGLVEVFHFDRFNQIDWVAQKARLYDSIQKYNAYGCVDATHDDAFADDIIAGEWLPDSEGRVKKRDGLPLEKVRITTNSIKRDLVDKLKLRMSLGLVKLPYPSGNPDDDENSWSLYIDELKYYTYTTTEAGNVTFAADAGYHDDCVMSLALLVKQAYGQYESRRPTESYHPESFEAVCRSLEAVSEQPMIIGNEGLA
jgi:hypothetical protein